MPQQARFLRLLDGLRDRLPAEFVAELRTRLAAGHVVEVAHSIAFAAVAMPVPLAEADVCLLISTLAGQGEQTAMAEAITRAGRSLLPGTA